MIGAVLKRSNKLSDLLIDKRLSESYYNVHIELLGTEESDVHIDSKMN